MCGICGIFGRPDMDTLISMRDTLKHRGSDGQGHYLDDCCGLGHQRLAIIDLSQEANQPMSNENKTVWVVANGEIYNYKELRASLVGKGHVFRSNSDNEVIPHLYEEYGAMFVSRLNGMFALAVYDSRLKMLLLARDTLGEKPLYYAEIGGRLVFASEIKALLKAMPCELNVAMIPTYLVYQYAMGTETLFKNVKKLSAGHRLIVGDGYTQLTNYGKFGQNRSKVPLMELLEQSVKLRLQADVPIGAFLSGGVDSSSVVALWRKYYSGEIHTFTATFENNSEAQYAKKVSRYLGTEYHEVKIMPDMVAKDIGKITWHNDEPLGDAAIINTYYLAQEAKRYVSVVLAGEGGDELFGGYEWYQYAPLIKYMNAIPSVIKNGGYEIVKLMGMRNPLSWGYSYGRALLFPCQKTLLDMLAYPTTAMSDLTARWILKAKDIIVELPKWHGDVCDVDSKMMVTDMRNLLPEKFLMKADKGTMAHALEERLPLLDKTIVNYAVSLPFSQKLDKQVLREAVADLLPLDIVWRPKQGFGTPVAEWLNGGLKELAVDRLNYGSLLRDICHPKSLAELVNYLVSGKAGQGKLALSPVSSIWSLLTLQIWHDVFWGEK